MSQKPRPPAAASSSPAAAAAAPGVPSGPATSAQPAGRALRSSAPAAPGVPPAATAAATAAAAGRPGARRPRGREEGAGAASSSELEERPKAKKTRAEGAAAAPPASAPAPAPGPSASAPAAAAAPGASAAAAPAAAAATSSADGGAAPGPPQPSLSSSIANMRGHVAELQQWMKREHPIHMGVQASAVGEMMSGVGEVDRVGFLAESGTGKSFLISLLLFLTAHDAREYASSAFRRGVQMEWRREMTDAAAAAAIVHRPHLPADQLQSLRQRSSASISDLHSLLLDAWPARAKSTLIDHPGWLLPSNAGAQGTTSVPVRIRYGRTFQLVLRYARKEELQKRAFGHVEKMQMKDDSAAERVQILHEALVAPGYALPSDDPALQALTPAAVPLHPSVLSVAGHTHVWEGIGATRIARAAGTELAAMDIDRQFVHDVLHALNEDKQRSAAIASVELFVPSQLLAEALELVDIPGCGDPNYESLVRAEAGACTALVVLSPQGMQTRKAVGDALRFSTFVNNLLRLTWSTQQMHIVHYAEKALGHTVWRDQKAQEKRALELAKFEKDTFDWLRISIFPGMLRDPASASALSVADLERRARERLHIYGVEPVAFASLALHLPTTRQLPTDAAVREYQTLMALCEQTGMLQLMGMLTSLARQRALQSFGHILGVSAGAAGSASSAVAAAAGIASSSPVGSALEGVHAELARAPLSADARVDIQRLLQAHAANRQELTNRIETAAVEAGIPNERARWTQHFRRICADLIRPGQQLQQQLLATGPVAQAEFRAARSQLKHANLHSSLHPAYKGDKGPLFLRRLVFGTLLESGIQSEEIIDRLRKAVTLFMSSRVREIAGTIIDSITQGFQQHPAAAAAKERALANLEGVLSLEVATLFTGALSAERLLSLFDSKACMPALRTYLQANIADFKRARSIEEVRNTLERDIPAILIEEVEEDEEDEEMKDAEAPPQQDAASASAAAAASSASAAAAAAPEAKDNEEEAGDLSVFDHAASSVADHFVQSLATLLDTRSKSVFWKALNYQSGRRRGNRSALLSVLDNFFVELTRLYAGDDGSSEQEERRRQTLSEMEADLHTWIDKAQQIMQEEQSDLPKHLTAHRSQILHSIAMKRPLTQSLGDVIALQEQLHAFQLGNWQNLARLTSRAVPASFRRVVSHDDAVLRALRQPAPRGDAATLADRQRKQEACISRTWGLNGTPEDQRLGDAPEARPQWNELERIAGNFGLSIAHIVSDGDCLFTAVAHQLAAVERARREAEGRGVSASAAPAEASAAALRPAELRALAVEYVRRRYTASAETRADFQVRYGEDVDAYYQRMSTSGVYAGEPELQALADMLDVEIALWYAPHGDPATHRAGQQPVAFRPRSRKLTPTGHLQDWHSVPTLHIAAVHGAGQLWEESGADGEPRPSTHNHFVSLVKKKETRRVSHGGVSVRTIPNRQQQAAAAARPAPDTTMQPARAAQAQQVRAPNASGTAQSPARSILKKK